MDKISGTFLKSMKISTFSLRSIFLQQQQTFEKPKFGATTLSITTLCIMTFRKQQIKDDTQPNDIRHNGSVFMLSVTNKPFMLSVVLLNVVMLNVVMLNVIMLNVFILNVVMLNVVMLSVVMLNVVMLNYAMLNVIMLNFVMLNVLMLNVVILNVNMLSVVGL
jgi:hypothetical protein